MIQEGEAGGHDSRGWHGTVGHARSKADDDIKRPCPAPAIAVRVARRCRPPRLREVNRTGGLGPILAAARVPAGLARGAAPEKRHFGYFPGIRLLPD